MQAAIAAQKYLLNDFIHFGIPAQSPSNDGSNGRCKPQYEPIKCHRIALKSG